MAVPQMPLGQRDRGDEQVELERVGRRTDCRGCPASRSACASRSARRSRARRRRRRGTTARPPDRRSAGIDQREPHRGAVLHTTGVVDSLADPQHRAPASRLVEPRLDRCGGGRPGRTTVRPIVQRRRRACIGLLNFAAVSVGGDRSQRGERRRRCGRRHRRRRRRIGPGRRTRPRPR